MRSLFLAALLFAPASFAKDWWADHPLQALDQPGGKTVVFELQPTVAAELVKQGGPGGAWCKLRFQKKEGWVPCADANRATPQVEKTPKPPPTNIPPQKPQKCAATCSGPKLFPKADAISLPEPVKQVLSLCPTSPNADAIVSAADVRRFFAAHYDDPRLQRALSVAGRAGRKEDNLDWLTSFWTGTGPKNAFTHVFCGDMWHGEQIGGLHWLPRFRQLEADGKLCFDGAVKKGKPKVGDNYLVRFHATHPWSCAEKPVGGFSAEEDPVALAALATRAFVKCCSREGKDGGIFSAPDLGKGTWQIHCGTRNGTFGINSFYPSDKKATCGE